MHDAGGVEVRDLLAGIIAWRDELGELGRDLERMLRAAGIRPTVPADRPGRPAPDRDPH